MVSQIRSDRGKRRVVAYACKGDAIWARSEIDSPLYGGEVSGSGPSRL
jgi:hypothetical protein